MKPDDWQAFLAIKAEVETFYGTREAEWHERARNVAPRPADPFSLWCPYGPAIPHPEWPHFCNCDDCTAKARLTFLSEAQLLRRHEQIVLKLRQVRRERQRAEREQSARQERGGPAHRGPAVPQSCGAVPSKRAPDPDLWAAATLNFPEIALAAARKLRFPSASEHDLSLATRLRQLDWTPQQIADALWWNRNKRREDLKHPGYYTRTVDRAVQSVAATRGQG